jgi:GntR family transcriptional regulator
MLFRVNPSSGVPLYIQLMEQVKHAVETALLQPGEQLPTIRKVAEDLVINPNTVVRAYRELEHEGVVLLRHGSGVYVSEHASNRAKVTRKGQTIIQSALDRLFSLGLTEDEMRRLFETEIALHGTAKTAGGKNG